MNSATLIARLVLCGVFALAGTLKLANLSTSRAAVEAFGLPRRLAGAAGTALPLAELGVAAALLPSPSARWGAAGALTLLGAFSAGVLRALRHGRAPVCNCFGQVSSAPIGSRTLARNGGLAVIAVYVLLEAPGSALTSWSGDASAANLVAALAVTLAGVVSALAWTRSVPEPEALPVTAQAATGSSTLPLGAPAPDFALPDQHGHLTLLRSLLAHGRPAVLIFASPHCGPCAQVLSQLSRWNAAVGEDVTLVVIESNVEGGQLPDELQALLDGLVALIEPGRELATRYGAAGTPCAIAITAAGIVWSRPMIGNEQVERLIRRVLATYGSMPAQAESPDGAERSVRRRGPRASRPSLSGEIFGVGVRLEAERADVLDQMTAWLPPAWRADQLGVQAASFVIRSETADMYELVQGGHPVERGTLEDVLGSYALRLRHHVAQTAPEHVFVRAGTAAFHGRAIIVAGESFSGKTTMVSALVTAGAAYYSDDYAVFDNHGLLQAYPKPGIARDSTGQRSNSSRAPHRLGAPTGDEPIRLGLVLCTRYRPGVEWAPVRLTPAQALVELMPHTFRPAVHAAQTLMTLGAAFDAPVIGLKGDRGDATALAPRVLASLAAELASRADG
jgi:thiol-disulfide isomerase/thioredoxin